MGCGSRPGRRIGVESCRSRTYVHQKGSIPLCLWPGKNVQKIDSHTRITVAIFIRDGFLLSYFVSPPIPDVGATIEISLLQYGFSFLRSCLAFAAARRREGENVFRPVVAQVVKVIGGCIAPAADIDAAPGRDQSCGLNIVGICPARRAVNVLGVLRQLLCSPIR